MRDLTDPGWGPPLMSTLETKARYWKLKSSRHDSSKLISSGSFVKDLLTKIESTNREDKAIMQ